MKRTVSIFLLAAIMLSLFSCTVAEPKPPVSLTKENVTDYVFLDYSFSELMLDEHTSSNIDYYAQCTLTVKIKPLADYDFNDASCEVSYSVPVTNGWRTIGGSTTLSGKKTVRLDKDGYGEAVINLYAYVFESYTHPAELDWSISITDAD